MLTSGGKPTAQQVNFCFRHLPVCVRTDPDKPLCRKPCCSVGGVWPVAVPCALLSHCCTTCLQAQAVTGLLPPAAQEAGQLSRALRPQAFPLRSAGSCCTGCRQAHTCCRMVWAVEPAAPAAQGARRLKPGCTSMFSLNAAASCCTGYRQAEAAHRAGCRPHLSDACWWHH